MSLDPSPCSPRPVRYEILRRGAWTAVTACCIRHALERAHPAVPRVPSSPPTTAG